jgi:hypothetical protein
MSAFHPKQTFADSLRYQLSAPLKSRVQRTLGDQRRLDHDELPMIRRSGETSR